MIRTLAATFITALALASSASAQLVYGLSNGFGVAALNQVYQINPANGDLSNIVPLSLPGFTIDNAVAMAADPITNVFYAAIQTTVDTAADRRLVIVDPNTGLCTNVGNFGRSVASLSYRSNGTLYAVTGQNGPDAETLFTINTANAAMTLQFPLGNGADGETIGFHANGLLYHSSGNTTALFESVNVDTQVVTPIGSATTEMFGMGYHPPSGQLLGSDIGSDLFSIDIATGARTFIGDMTDQLGAADNRAIVFTPVPEPASLALTTFAVAGFAFCRKLRKSRKA